MIIRIGDGLTILFLHYLYPPASVEKLMDKKLQKIGNPLLFNYVWLVYQS